jgi:hypothetical protein
MIGYTDAPRAWGFTCGAARVVGVDLTGAVVDGWLSRRELGAMVETCTSCGQEVPCTDWLAHTAKAEQLPVYCPNKAVIEALKP